MPPATFWRPALAYDATQPNHATRSRSAADDERALADQGAVVVLRTGSQTRPDEPGVAAGAESLDVDARPSRPFRQHLLAAEPELDVVVGRVRDSAPAQGRAALHMGRLARCEERRRWSRDALRQVLVPRVVERGHDVGVAVPVPGALVGERVHALAVVDGHRS